MTYPMIRNILVLFLVATTAPVHAQDLDAESLDALQRFYQRFDGEQWHHNDGWQDPQVNPCDWYGVRCGTRAGSVVIRELNLPNNNLQGDLSGSDIFEYISGDVWLQGNAITGTLPVFPHWLEIIDLSDNRLTGPLPEAPQDYGDTILHLELARNDIGGTVPESWGALGIAYLDLSGNRLTDGYDIGLRAADNYANLADNEFSGTLDDVIVSHLLDHNESATAGGVNLCWNDFSISSNEKVEQIGQRHVGGDDFQNCLARQRRPIDRSISGSWFYPNRSGEGVTVHLLEGGGVSLYHFGFDSVGRQHWLVGLGRESETSLHWPNRIEGTRGRFGEGVTDNAPLGMGRVNDWRMDRLGSDSFHLERNYSDFTHCQDRPPTPMPCAARPRSDRFDYDRLTRLAGSTCDNQHPLQNLSGAWYDPKRSGEGFLVEVLEDGSGLVYWFTYQPDDSLQQAWMVGTGQFEGQTLYIDEMVQPIGGAWGTSFDPSAIVEKPWGSLTLDFSDDESGHAYWDSVDPAYGSGDHPIRRLSRMRLADCDNS